MRCDRVCSMNDPDKGCLLGGVEPCRIGSEKAYKRKKELENLTVEELIYDFTVNQEGELLFRAQTEDYSGRELRILARGADGKMSTRIMLAHASTPTEREVDVFRSALKEAITDVVFPKEGVRWLKRRNSASTVMDWVIAIF